MPKISELPTASSVADGDYVPVVQGGVTKKAAKSLLGGAAPGGSNDEIQVKNGSAFAGATNVKAGSGYVSIGASPATFGGLRLANDTFIYARGGGANVPLLGLSASDVVQLGAAGGYPIEISASATDPITLLGIELYLKTGAIQIGGVGGATLDVGGGVGGVVGWDNVTSAPSSNPTDGIILYPQDGKLKYRTPNATEPVQLEHPTVVNIMDYYVTADGGASYNLGGVAVTTKNIANAMDRAYDAMIATKQAFTLWIPPAYLYGVTCYSWKESLTWDVSESGDNVQAFEIVGSGQASIIIPDNSAANDDKLYVAGAGPDCLSMLFAYRRMFWMGDEDDTNDCTSVLRTSVDMDVLIDECTFYSVQSNSATSGVINLDTMGATVRRTYFHGCSNSGADGAVVYVGTGCFGVRFEHVQFYPWERTPRNPLGGTNYDKGQIQAKYHVRIAGGSTLDTATRFTADQCTFAENGTYGAVLAHPGANLVDTIHMRQCVTYSNIIRSLECRANVRHAIVDQCQFKHNNGGQATIEMAAATCERLTVRGTEIGSGLSVNANTGQHLVEILGSEGGTYDVSGATHFILDAASSLAGLSSATPAPAARVPETAIVKNDATDLTLTATQYARDMLNITGTPGGAFNVIGPNAARTRFTVLNQTASDATIKKSGGTGITVAGNRAAQVYHNGTDYIRLTADSVLT